MIQEIRDYIDDCIVLNAPNRVLIDDAFANDDIYNIPAGEAYRLAFGTVTCERQGNEYSNQMPVTLEIFNDRSGNDQESFDLLMEESFCLRKALQDPKTMPFTDIDVTSIEPFFVENNDRFIGMRLTLTVREDYSY